MWQVSILAFLSINYLRINYLRNTIQNPNDASTTIALQDRIASLEKDLVEHQRRLRALPTSTTPAPSNNTRNSLSPTAADQWCPNAECESTAQCVPCQRRFLMLVASGRSASTTAQVMLDSLPGIRMTGENNDALNLIVEAMNTVRHDKDWVRGGSAWTHNDVKKPSYACLVQKFMETFNPPELPPANPHEDDATIVGFKTIRFIKPSSDVSQAAQLIREHLPCSRVVINYRSDVNSQIKSLKSTFESKQQKRILWKELTEKNTALRKLAEELGPRQAFLLDSSDWTENVTHFNDMVRWLGFHDECAFERAFQFNTGGNGYGKGDTIGRRIPPKCVKLMN